MQLQAFIAVLADNHNLDTTDIMEMFADILDRVDLIEEVFDPTVYTEIFESFQRQEANEALATDFVEGRAVGFSEVRYNPETGEEVSVDDTYGILDYIADCAF